MRTIPTRHYEAMFILSQAAAVDLAGVVGFLKDMLAKNGASIVALKKWADRPLAYPIKKQKRGVYILCYFASPTDKLGSIERACNLSEQILRTLIVNADHLTVDEMKATDAQLDLMIEANLRGHGGQPGAGAPAPAPAAVANN